MDQDLVGVVFILEVIQRQALVIHIKAVGDILAGVTATLVFYTVMQVTPTDCIDA